MQQKQATLKDIAALAEVSISTVSRVVNGTATKAARPEVQTRIWDAVKELNYVPNTAAQMLKTTVKKPKLKTIACIFSRAQNFQNDPFFSEISRAIETELLKLGYLMKFSISTYEHPKETIESLLSTEEVDGVIILGRIEKRNVELIRKFNKNIIYVGLNKLNDAIDQVICDGYEATQKALVHLANRNIKEIYYLGETTNEVRFESYKSFMNQRGFVENLRRFVIETPFSSQGANHSLKKLLQQGIVPKGIFCGNDLTAIGAIKAIKQQGLRIPEDIALVSIDNTEMAQFSSPMLTSVSVPMEQLGKTAAKLVVDHSIERNQLPITVLIPSVLVVRESS